VTWFLSLPPSTCRDLRVGPDEARIDHGGKFLCMMGYDVEQDASDRGSNGDP
jgi:hypothetical protein